MKNMLIYSMVFAVMFFASSAHALKSYNYDSRNIPLTLDSGESWSKIYVLVSPSREFADDYLDLTLTSMVSGSSGKPPLGLFFPSIDQSNFISSGNLTTIGMNTFHITGLGLDHPNSILQGSGGIPFDMTLLYGGIALKSARLYGNIAPNPISIALVAAVLAGLPFARRLISSITRG